MATVTKVLGNVKGPKGDQGIQGTQGPLGYQGVTPEFELDEDGHLNALYDIGLPVTINVDSLWIMVLPNAITGRESCTVRGGSYISVFTFTGLPSSSVPNFSEMDVNERIEWVAANSQSVASANTSVDFTYGDSTTEVFTTDENGCISFIAKSEDPNKRSLTLTIHNV